jgi:WD40 repeat protein
MHGTPRDESNRDGVTSAAFSPDGKLLVSGGFNETVRHWEVATAKEIQCLACHGANVTSLASSPDGTRLVSGLVNGPAVIWDLSTTGKSGK